MKMLQVVLAIGACAALAGCGAHSTGDRPPVQPVCGKLLIGGKAAPGAEIVLYPISARAGALVRPHAVASEDGSFELTTFATHDGAPQGEFVAMVTWPSAPPKGQDGVGPDRLHERYASRKTPAATLRITAETSSLATIDLKPVSAAYQAATRVVKAPVDQ